MSDRYHVERRDVITYVVLGLQLAAIIWGAARLSASVDMLQVTSVEIRGTLREIGRQLADQDARVRVLEDRTRTAR